MTQTTVTRGATPRGRRSERSVAEPGRGARPPGPPDPPEPIDFDGLVEHWWTALAASESALRAAARMPGGHGVFPGRQPPATERAETMRSLTALGHEIHTDSRLLPWLTAPSVTNRMLGLPPAIAVCIFDLDGVLTTSADVHAAAWAETFDRFLVEQAERHHRPYIPFDRRRDYESLVAERPRRDGVRSFLTSRGITLPEGSPDDPPGTGTIHGLANRKNELLQRRLSREGVIAFAGSRSYVQAVRMAGLHSAVVSPSANTSSILERAGLESLVDASVDGDMIEADHLRPKPAPDLLVTACRLLGVEPGRAAAFETTPAGVVAARAAEVAFVVAVHRTGDGEVLRASNADVVVGDLSELFG